MSEFLEDPSVLTKDKLKSALLAHNVALPNGDQRKDVYVQLYLKNLTAQNKKSSGSPDVFSSDEELAPAPVISNRSRSGRKATRKTDKVRPEDVDVTELSNEGLKDLLLKYGLNAGPIVASTRKVYEKRLQKLLDQGPPEAVAPPSETTQTDGSQNGNTDSDQYSDKEEETVAPAPVSVPEPEMEVEAEPIPVVERPVRSRGKTPVTSRTRSGQFNRDLKEVSVPLVRINAHVLAVPKEPKPSKLSSMSATEWSESLKHHIGSYQSTISSLHGISPVDKFVESAADITSLPIRPSNREPLVSLLNTACIEVDGQGMQDILSCRPASRASLAQEVQSVSVSKFSKPHLSQNKPSKPLMDMRCHHSSSCDGQREVFPSRSLSFRDSIVAPGDSLPVSFGLSQGSCGSPENQPKTRQSKITPFFSQITSVRGLDNSQMETPKKMVEKVSAIDQTPRTVERDVLKEIFPTENLSTPTGISATCRRPIRGAAGRPLGEAWLDESRLRHTVFRETCSSSHTETRSVPRVAAVPLAATKPAAPPAVKTRARRSLSLWVQLLLLSAVAGFLFFVYQAMETNEVGLFKQSGADDGTSK
ncbi:thymopoietin a isoform X5 [Pseudorasbora parva]|uniref:thymopoietin a isoform X5 n=1 Tax=Pseudorasbora parva TaxID=51549 RepID=UPI00351EA86E